MKNKTRTFTKLFLAAFVLGFGLHASGQNNPSRVIKRGLSSELAPSPADDQVQLTIAKKDAAAIKSVDANDRLFDMRQAAASGRWPTTSSASSGLGYVP